VGEVADDQAVELADRLVRAAMLVGGLIDGGSARDYAAAKADMENARAKVIAALAKDRLSALPPQGSGDA
jgi:hypothetical protein